MIIKIDRLMITQVYEYIIYRQLIDIYNERQIDIKIIDRQIKALIDGQLVMEGLFLSYIIDFVDIRYDFYYVKKG